VAIPDHAEGDRFSPSDRLQDDQNQEEERMRVSDQVACIDFPCVDVNHDLYLVPGIDLDPSQFSMVLISEAAPPDPADYYYAGGDPSFQQTTVQAFRDAGAGVDFVQDLLNLGVYLTTAVKCGKTAYGIKAATVKACSLLLEAELALFSNAQVFMLMGDVAIKAVNHIARRNGEPRVIPAGATYKIRGDEYYFQGKRAFPSYLQAGPSYFIERSKRQMIAEDLAAALALVG
jgi:uracil-DNA glycosylase